MSWVAKSASRYNIYLCIEFDISGVVCRSDGANAPITISSKTNLDQLRVAVAEKLDRFPGLVALQYRLSSDNSKARAISIQSNEELKLFKDRMRQLIVPPRLANGKASSRILKAVLVYFEDASSEVKEISTSSGNSKKVLVFCCSAAVISYFLYRVFQLLRYDKSHHLF